MAGMRFTFEVLGTTQVDRTLARFSENVKTGRPLWAKLAEDFGRIERQQFNSEGAESGGWASLSPAYAAWKSRHYPGKPILEATGALKRSVTERPYAVEVITDDAMTVGTDIPYAPFHQHGTTRMPRRPVVSLTEANRRRWVNTIQRYVVTGKV